MLSDQDTETKETSDSSEAPEEKEVDHLSDLSELEKIKAELQKWKEKAAQELAEGDDEEGGPSSKRRRLEQILERRRQRAKSIHNVCKIANCNHLYGDVARMIEELDEQESELTCVPIASAPLLVEETNHHYETTGGKLLSP